MSTTPILTPPPPPPNPQPTDPNPGGTAPQVPLPEEKPERD